MIVIAGRVVIDPARREEAVRAALEMMEETAREPGCISYTFSADLEEPGVFRVFEEWDSPEALAAHFKTPHMAAFNKVMASVKVLGMDIKQYEVSGTKQLLP